jgi:hypothetical protein
MMNMIELQDKLKNFSQEQLVGMMQQPTGEAPQFMVLSEITRRQKMQQEASKTPTQSVAQEAVAAAGVPQGGIADMARTLAPQTNVAQNTGAMSAPPQGMPSAPQGIAQMASGGVVKMAEAGKISESMRSDMRLLADASRKGMTIDEYWDTLTPAAKARYEYFDRLEDRGDKVSTFMDSLKGISGEISDAASQAGTAYTDAMGPYSMFGRDSLVQTPEPTVVTPPYDPTSVDRNPPPAQQVTPIDPNTYPAGKFGSPATYGGPDVYGNRGEDPYAPYYQEYLPTGQETTPISIPRTSEVDSSGMDLVSMLRAQEDARTNADLGSGRTPRYDTAIGPQPTSPSPSELAAQEESRRRVEGYDRQFINDERNFPVPNEPIVFDVREGAPQTISAMAANLDGTSATGTLAGGTPSNVGIMQDPTQVTQGEIPKFAQGIGDYFSDLWKKANDPSKINIAGYSDPNIVEIPALGAIDTETDTAPVVKTTANTDTGIPLYAQEGFDSNNLVPKTKTSTGGGLNSGRYSDYQQQLIDMLDSRKDEAKSDKWMALAQAGMALMQGGTGSFGGDLGKAGQTGLAALQESNKSARQDRFGVLKTLADIDATNRSLQIQAQAASQKGILNPKDYVTMYQATAEEAMDAMDKLSINGTPLPGAADLYENARAMYDESMVNIRKLLGMGGANNKLAGNYNVIK